MNCFPNSNYRSWRIRFTYFS